MSTAYVKRNSHITDIVRKRSSIIETALDKCLFIVDKNWRALLISYDR